MPDSWEQVPKKIMSRFAALQNIYDVKDNHKQYRAMLRDVVPPAIPYVGTCCSWYRTLSSFLTVHASVFPYYTRFRRQQRPLTFPRIIPKRFDCFGRKAYILNQWASECVEAEAIVGHCERWATCLVAPIATAPVLRDAWEPARSCTVEMQQRVRTVEMQHRVHNVELRPRNESPLTAYRAVEIPASPFCFG